MARRCRSAVERDPLDDLAPVRCRSSIAGSGGEKSRLGTLFKDTGGGGGDFDGGFDGGGGPFVFGGWFVAKDRKECAHARRGADLANTANIRTTKTGIFEQKFCVTSWFGFVCRL
jgi:hypothetical protein